MNKVQVRLDTQSEVTEFVSIATTIAEETFLEDGTGLRVDAKSLLGVMYGTTEFKQLYVMSENEQLDSKFSKFMI